MRYSSAELPLSCPKAVSFNAVDEWGYPVTLAPPLQPSVSFLLCHSEQYKCCHSSCIAFPLLHQHRLASQPFQSTTSILLPLTVISKAFNIDIMHKALLHILITSHAHSPVNCKLLQRDIQMLPLHNTLVPQGRSSPTCSNRAGRPCTAPLGKLGCQTFRAQPRGDQCWSKGLGLPTSLQSLSELGMEGHDCRRV